MIDPIYLCGEFFIGLIKDDQNLEKKEKVDDRKGTGLQV
jgi:hypothetical protein